MQFVVQLEWIDQHRKVALVCHSKNVVFCKCFILTGWHFVSISFDHILPNSVWHALTLVSPNVAHIIGMDWDAFGSTYAVFGANVCCSGKQCLFRLWWKWHFDRMMRFVFQHVRIELVYFRIRKRQNITKNMTFRIKS